MLRVYISCASIVLATALPVTASAPVSASSPTKFNVSSTAKVPGLTLEPGAYTIRVVNKLSDRLILTVDSANGDRHSTFLGIPNRSIPRPSHASSVSWSNPANGLDYLRGFYFPGGPAVTEFVYPKAEAVSIANSNQDKVPAIDPASEGRVADPTLSDQDMKLVTLWLLSAERVGPSATASIKAERYQQVGYTQPKVPLTALPHTASSLPWLWLVSLCSLLAAISIRGIRVLTPKRAGTPVTSPPDA